MSMSCYLNNAAAVMIVIVSLSTPAASTDACSYGKSPPEAIIGERMVLTCQLNQSETCFSGNYDWYRLNHNEYISLSERSQALVVSENVISAADIGGQMYKCHCSSETQYCLRFRIGVKPRVSLHVSSEVAKSGSSVNVTCTAESYPPADSVNNYQMKHPKNTPIDRTPLPGMNGVVHVIISASKIHDAGDYECTVNVTMEEYSTPLQSDIATANLGVYDPPKVVNVHNFTIAVEVEQCAVLECAIHCADSELKVWANWTTKNKKEITKKHVMLQKEGVFYLLVYNATVEDYICEVYSEYSPYTPEDKTVVSVMISEMNEKQKDCNISGLIAGIVVPCILFIILFVAMIITFAIGGFKFRRMKSKQKDKESHTPSTVGNKQEDKDSQTPFTMVNRQEAKESHILFTVGSKQEDKDSQAPSITVGDDSTSPRYVELPPQGTTESDEGQVKVEDNKSDVRYNPHPKPVEIDNGKDDDSYIANKNAACAIGQSNDSNGEEEDSSISPVKAIPRLFQRSQSVFAGSPPSSLQRNFIAGSFARQLSKLRDVHSEESEGLLSCETNETKKEVTY